MSAANRFVFEGRPGEVRSAALGADGAPIAFRVTRSSQPSLVGAVYLARVKAVRSELKAAFLDIGQAQDAFLNIGSGKDALGTKIAEGAAILVQVDRDPEGTKGPRVTTRIELSSRNLVVVGGGDVAGLRVSRSIKDADWTQAAENTLAGLCPEDAALTVRTRAATTPVTRLGKEAAKLISIRNDIFDQVAKADAPSELFAPLSPAVRFLSVWCGTETPVIITNDADIAHVIAAWDADFACDMIQGSAFAETGLDDAFASALDPVVPLPGGGRLVIAETEALVAIDVDAAGRRDGPLSANLAAAKAVGDTIRLRNLNGLIVVDFLKLRSDQDKAKLMEAVRAAIDLDPLRPRAAGVSSMGLVEIERRRDHLSLGAMCLHRTLQETPETRALAALNAVQMAAGADPSLEVATDVAAALDGVASDAKRAVERRLGIDIKVTVVSDAPAVGYRLVTS